MQAKVASIAIFIMVAILTGCSGGQWSHVSPRNNALQGSYQYTYQPLLLLANEHVAEAQYALGYLFFYGRGVAQDRLRATQWIDKANALHYGPAMLAKEAISTHTAMTNDLPYPPLLQAVYTQQHYRPDLVDSPWNYIIQLASANDKTALERLAKQYGLQHQVVIYQVSRVGGNWYVLSYGAYATQMQAATAQKNLASTLQVLHPWVRPMLTLQPILLKTKVS